MVAGVSAAVARRLGRDVTLVRVVFVLLGLVGGLGLAAYVVAWMFIPREGEGTSIAARSAGDARGIALALALIPLVVVVLLVSRALGATFFGSFLWPVLVSGGGLVLIWRNASEAEQESLRHLTAWFVDLSGSDGRRQRFLWGRFVAGLLLLVGGLSSLLVGHPSHTVVKPLGGLALVAAAIVVFFGPWWLRLGRDLVSERQARVRAEERADMASRVHDSVLQTLALIQGRADQPNEVVKLARAQERELRSWLFDGQPLGSANEQDETLSEGIHRIQLEVEATHAVAVETVVVGEERLDDSLRGMLAAGKEAVVNAAKWSGAPVVSVFAEAQPDGVSMFVRDRGAGFDASRVPADRKGIAESIEARMSRAGGSAEVRSRPGEGTEIALWMPSAGGRSEHRVS